jgi:hypothetical protein
MDSDVCDKSKANDLAHERWWYPSAKEAQGDPHTKANKHVCILVGLNIY